MRRFSTCSILPLLAALGLGACDRASSNARPAASAARGQPDRVYIVRGKIEQLPDPARPVSEFVVHHEAIDDFQGFNGEVGMDSMSMPFPLGADASVQGLHVGDIVEIELGVWMQPGRRGYEARRVSPLPADTALTFRKAMPTLAAPK